MRNVLLDTHIFLCSQFESGKLSAGLRSLLASDDVRWHLSQVSILEIQVKHDAGRLPLPSPPQDLIPDLLDRSGFAFQSLQDEAIYMLGRLPPVHRDPFDRLLIATALVNGWEIATVDTTLEKYPVRLVR